MNIPQTEEELRGHLKDQIHFLVESSNAYDSGFTSEAKRLAVAIRILVHDTASSPSLLTLLNRKDILFYDTAYDYDPSNLLVVCGLLMIRMGTGGAEYVAPLGTGSPQRYSNGKIPFVQWWDKIVLVDGKGAKFTRGGLVLKVCDKDGGAHVDPKLDEPYHDFSRGNSLGWRFLKDGVEQDSVGRPELASVRQIGFEVLKSLEDEFPRVLLNAATEAIVLHDWIAAAHLVHMMRFREGVRCLCGQGGPVSCEHVPPRAAFNDSLAICCHRDEWFRDMGAKPWNARVSRHQQRPRRGSCINCQEIRNGFPPSRERRIQDGFRPSRRAPLALDQHTRGERRTRRMEIQCSCQRCYLLIG